MNKQLILTIAGLAIIAVSLSAAKTSLAHGNQEYTNIIQRISERFNVPQDQVQEVFDEVRADHHAKMEELFEDRLGFLVSEGQISEQEKEQILARHEEPENGHHEGFGHMHMLR